MTSPIQRSFAGGEISPQLYGRVDQQKYASGLRTCRNMAVMRHGGVVNRPGLQFVYETPDQARLIPFVFNQKDGETFIVVITSTNIKFLQDGAPVVEGAITITGITNANPGVVHAPAHGYTTGDEVVISGVGGMTQLNGRNFLVVVTDANHFTLRTVQALHTNINTTSYGVYSAGGVANRVYAIISGYSTPNLIQYAQTGDVLTIVHPNATPKELQRISALNWQLTTIVFKAPVDPPTALIITGGFGPSPGNNAWYLVTAVNANGDETEVQFAATNGTDSILVNAANLMTLSWTASANAVSYRVYKTIISGGNGVHGFIGTASTTSFVDYGITPDYLDAAPTVGPLYNVGAGDYPSTVGFIQQRRGFANSINNPTTTWLSRSGSFSNFSYHNVGAQPDDDPITFVPANERVNSIEHLLELRQPLLLTSGSEIAINGNSSGTVTPSAVNPQAQSYFGSGVLKPITFGDVCLFQQARGWFVRDLGYAFEVNGYRGNDLTIFSSHLFEGFTLVNWSYQQIPNSIAWMARSDGKFLGLTYVREQQILAWHKHDTYNGSVLDVTCIPENPEDGVYFSVERTIGSVSHFYVERMANFHWDDITDVALMDSWLQYGPVASSGLSGVTVTQLFGGTSWDYDAILNVSFNTSLSPALNLGDQFWVTSSSGDQIRFTIVQVFSASAYYARPSKIVPVDLRGTLNSYILPVQTVTNLWTLEGQTVSVFADGFVVGSPNNPTIPTQYIVTNGQITLDKPYSKIFVGLPITYDIETLDMDTAVGDSILDTKKNITRVAAYVINTRGIFAGRRNPDTDPLNTTADAIYGLVEKKPEAISDYDDVWPLETRPIYINIEANWNRNGRIFIRQVDPVPMQIVSIVAEGKVATNSQNLRV